MWIRSLVLALCLAVAAPALAGYKGKGKGKVPPGHLPPPGLCRVWFPDRPPGHQPPPGPCQVLRYRLPAGARLIEDGPVVGGAAAPQATLSPLPGTISKEAAGTLLGAAAGGLIGSRIGDGDGKLAAVGAGVLLGAVLGGEIGRSLDRADRLYAERATTEALEAAPAGITAVWRNPDSGRAGSVTPGAAYRAANGRTCRTFRQTVTIGGAVRTAEGTACRDADGAWRIAGS